MLSFFFSPVQDLIKDSALFCCVSVLSQSVIVPLFLLVFHCLETLKSSCQLLCKISLTLFSCDLIKVLLHNWVKEYHGGEMSFSVHHIKGT